MKKQTLMKILTWLAQERTGLSSECMAFTAAGIECRRYGSYPHDPSDFNRCLVLIHNVPEIRTHFSDIAKLNIQWKALISRWDELEETFIEEVGFNWSKADSAPKTYALMKEILKGAKA
ncbi:hypothetical protein [Vibrio parahaemolyticus]|uniref:hypothetical protein n=1 Tax=Vibrio parahaemolyticus TaxID=670 RepID=UPI00387AFE12